MTAEPDGTTQRIRLRRKSGTTVLHVIEVLGYHVHGWKRVRCLTHGEELGPAIDRGDDTQTAISAARSCAHIRQLPFAPHRDPLAPLLPAVDVARAEAARS